jgi:type I restriction enzyme, S subunit
MTWAEIAIGDLGRIVTGDTPPRKNPEYYGSAYPFIKPTDMTVGQRLTMTYEEGYSEDGFEKYRKKLIPAGSTAVVTIGSIGQKLTWLHADCFVNQAVNAVVPDRAKFDSLYVYYLLKHNLNLVKQADTGASSGRENVSKSNFSALTVWACLDLNTQRQIAEVLDALDSSIETNQRRIALLEDAARRLYREWFVHLRFPGHESVPVKDGVPEGWRKTPIVEQTSLLNRGIAPKYDKTAKSRVINQKCIRDGRILMEPARRQSKEVKPDRLVRMGDVLINSTGAGTLGRVAQVWSPIENCTVDTHVTIARPIDEGASTYFGQALLNLEPVFSEMGKGATNQLELSRSDIGAIEIWQPPPHLYVEFRRLVGPMLEQADQLSIANLSLQKARDQLLPRLMSGQLGISGIRLPEEVVA